MSIHDFSGLRDLVGVWSCSTFLASLIGAWFSRLNKPVGRLQAKASGTAAMLMLLFALFIVLIAIPATMSYSGPESSADRGVRRYDKYFAMFIALAFAAVFAFDSLRLSWKARKENMAQPEDSATSDNS
jgi:cytochrome bd-type quinol oxidase subunit 2